MSEDVVVVAETGRVTGSRPSRRMRHEGKVPATLYGLGLDPLTIAVDWRDLRHALTTEAGTNALIQLEVEGRRQATLIKEVQRHPVRRDVLHIDFLRVDLDVAIDIEVPIELVGEAEEIMRAGAIVQQLLHTLVVSAKPNNIPNSLTLDVSSLTLDGELAVRDLTLPAGVTTDADPDEVVAQGLVTSAAVSSTPEPEPTEPAPS